MSSKTEDRFIFETEWFDERAELIRPYNLIFYPRNNTIEMVSILLRTMRLFSKFESYITK